MSNYKSLEDFCEKQEQIFKRGGKTFLLLSEEDLIKDVSETYIINTFPSFSLNCFKYDCREISRRADLTIYIDQNLNLYFKKQRRYFESYNLNDLASELCEFFNNFRNKKVDLFQFEIFQTLIEIRRKNPKMINKPINFLKYYNNLYKDKEDMIVYIFKDREGIKKSNNLNCSFSDFIEDEDELI